MARTVYSQVLREFDWDALQADCVDNAVDSVKYLVGEGDEVRSDGSVPEGLLDGSDTVYGQAFLGTVFGLYPSGKYYQPWACSNVDPCPSCKGSGKSKRVKDCATCGGSGSRVVQDFWAKSWRDELGIQVGDIVECNVCKGSGEVALECSRCHGIGSEEAWQDQRYQECLERAADKYGGWVQSGEGDLCDVFFCLGWDTIGHAVIARLSEEGITLS